MKRGTPEHHKLLDLADDVADKLDVGFELAHLAVVGLCEMLWQETARYAPAGDIGKLSNRRIAHKLKWTSDADWLIGRLVARRLLDEHPEHRLVVHRCGGGRRTLAWRDAVGLHGHAARHRNRVAGNPVREAARFLADIMGESAENAAGNAVAVWSDPGRFEFRGLTGGFESSLEALPDLLDRELTDREQQLRRQVAELGGSLGDAFNERFGPRVGAALEALGLIDSQLDDHLAGASDRMLEMVDHAEALNRETQAAVGEFGEFRSLAEIAAHVDHTVPEPRGVEPAEFPTRFQMDSDVNPESRRQTELQEVMVLLLEELKRQGEE